MNAEGVTRDFFEAWHEPELESIMAFFADDAVLVDPYGTHRGSDAIRVALAAQVDRVDHVEPELVSIASDGGTVLVERIERVQLGDGTLVVEGVVVVTVDQAGRITRFRDYHDPASIVPERQ